jgi:glutamyl-tRNA synthetase
MSSVRVRFAPSPTGTLHVGGARTALFNWLYARSQGGVFILRIEDTDQERSSEESHQQILRAMLWMGLDWDEGPKRGGGFGPYVQSERRRFYDEFAQRLLSEGHLYECYCTADELEQRRASTSGVGYDGRCRGLTADARAAFVREGRPHVLRARMPDSGSIKWTDLVLGDTEFECAVLDDWVAVKSDGFPTYNFACVVDDVLMQISHVLRGNDHVSNTPRQIQLFRALGLKPPKYGHMPMILGPDGKRLSKRHGSASVEDFRDERYLPEAFLNYLALLGWSSGSDQEVFTIEELVRKFSLRRLNKAAAIFDPEKFRHINAEHLKRHTPAERAELVWPVLVDNGVVQDSDLSTHDRLPRLMELMGNRLSHVGDAPAHLAAYLGDEYPLDPEGAGALEQPAARLLPDLADSLDRLAAFDAASIEQSLRELAERRGVKAGDLIHAARYAATGQRVGPSVFEALEFLGKQRVAGRLRQPLRP